MSNTNSNRRENETTENEGENATTPAENRPPAAAAPARQSPWQTFKSFAFRMLMFYFITQFFRRSPTNPPGQNETMPVNPKGGTYSPGNLYANGEPMDLYLFLNEIEQYEFDPMRKPIWMIDGWKYGDWSSKGTLTKFIEFPISENVKNNGSLFLHVVVTKHGHSIDPTDRESHSAQMTFFKSKRLNKYKKKVYKKTKNLLTGNTEQNEEYQKKADENRVELLSHWHPNITINLLDDHSPWTKGSIPPPMDQYFEFDLYTGKYYPVLYLNDYWNLLADYYPVNNTFETLNLTVTLTPIQLWKWQMYISQNLRQSWYGNILGDEENDDDQDAMKRAMVETNPYLLAVTVIVSIVHTVFEILAFKNDIQFWRTRKSLEGLSVRSVFFNIFQSFIVLLYVLDNETNTMVRISVFVGILIEMWKVPKVLNFQRVQNEFWLGFLPKYRYVYKQSYTDTSTSDYDQLAFKYLSWILFPLVIGYACYNLTYHEQKSWYSFCLSTIYGFLLTFGFIMMTPQLFINYKLKSVSHLPWRMMTYKALNTFIDDLFAFVIKMPTMYRLGCFRDDIIFFIYLYQRYIYPVDRTRLNEFGTTGETDSAVVPTEENAPVEHEKTE
uniref:Cleft lip and palate associated transmembrane n=1 Tax=Philodina roseola TaxID=96448 RepID=B5AHC7_PHIRO|nr:cleft lip and palate associated transmembrane [Philodina roseola]